MHFSFVNECLLTHARVIESETAGEKDDTQEKSARPKTNKKSSFKYVK